MLNDHSMEAHTRTHEIPERPTDLDSFIKANSEHGSRYRTCSCIRSHRTEDISVREDENGIRSHFCPLSMALDGPRDENEGYPDQPMKLEFDLDHIFNHLSLKSEEITCLMAEKPTLSECEDVNTSSDVDATTSMIYGLSQNRRKMQDSVSLEYLCKHKTKYFPAQRKLDEKTMSSWIEESSDDTEYYSSDRDTETTFKAGYESDMEEFEEMPVKENDAKILRCRSNQEDDDEIFKLVSKRNGIPNAIITNKTENTTEYLNMIGIENTDLEKDLREIYSRLQHFDEKELDGDDISEQTFESGKRPELTCDQGENSNSLKKEIDTKYPNLTRRCASVQDKMLENCSTGSSEKKPPAETKAPEIHLSEDSKFNKTDDVPSTNIDASNGATDFSKTEENEPKSKMESKVKKSQGFDDRKGDRRNNFAMEPVDMHSEEVSRDEETQPDLATALRFMTEIYPTKDEDELYSDTLSTTDLPPEVPNAEKSADSLISQDIQLKQTTGRPVDATSPNKSSTFEPVLTEDEKSGKRSRNKFSKFFKSFKRRLAAKKE